LASTALQEHFVNPFDAELMAPRKKAIFDIWEFININIHNINKKIDGRNRIVVVKLHYLLIFVRQKEKYNLLTISRPTRIWGGDVGPV
jgi:hypothetical protein